MVFVLEWALPIMGLIIGACATLCILLGTILILRECLGEIRG